jgi:outer membrane protein
MLRNSALSIGVLSVCVFAPSLHAQDDNARRLSELARNAAQQFAAARAEVDQTRPAAGLATPGPNVELSLDDATARALERNLDIAVERLNPQLLEYNLARLRASYRPTATSTIGHRAVVQPPTNQLNGGLIVQNDSSTYNGGLAQALPWGGGDFAFQFNNLKQVTNNLFANFNPTFTSNFAATFTQPLLRGFMIDGVRQQLLVTAINRDISEIQVRSTLATTVADVRNAYWELLFAFQALDVARGSLDLADKLVEDNRARVEVGTLAPLDVVQSEAEAATRRQTVAQAEATLGTAQLALKRLIVSGTDDPLWRSTITPIDRPEFRPEPLDVEGAVTKALAARTDLEQARKTIDSNDVTIKFLRNETLPGVDFVANYGAQGLGGTQFIRSGGLGSPVTGTIPGGYSNAWSTLTSRDFPNWNVQVNVSYPLGGSAQDAQYARARVQRNQSAAQLRALELQVATDVTNAALQVDSGLKRYEASVVARDLAQTRLSAEQSRFEVGLSTNFFVVQAQRDLATAQNAELRALLDYRRALVDYARVQEAPAQRGPGITPIQAGGGNQ